MTNINGICIITDDVQRLAAFYGEALEVPFECDDAYGFVRAPGASLSFYSKDGMERMAPGSMQAAASGAITIEVQVDDVDRAHQRMLAMNAPVVKPPTTQEWGWRSAWFRDPDGNILNLCAPVAPHATHLTRVIDFFERLINKKDLSVCDEMLAPEYVDHDAPEDTPTGPEPSKEYTRHVYADQPDRTITIEDAFAAGNRVALRMVWRGTSISTGKLEHFRGIVLLRLDDQGRIVERWGTYDDIEG